jgi:hypothetical protein
MPIEKRTGEQKLLRLKELYDHLKPWCEDSTNADVRFNGDTSGDRTTWIEFQFRPKGLPDTIMRPTWILHGDCTKESAKCFLVLFENWTKDPDQAPEPMILRNTDGGTYSLYISGTKKADGWYAYLKT